MSTPYKESERPAILVIADPMTQQDFWLATHITEIVGIANPLLKSVQMPSDVIPPPYIQPMSNAHPVLDGDAALIHATTRTPT